MQRELRAHAPHGFDVDVSVHALDDPLHDIHADPAAGLVADLFGRGESRQENELDRFSFRHVLGDVRADQSPLDRFGANLLDIESGAVVFDFDQDGVAAMGGMQIDRTGRRLPLRDAHGRRFDAVVDGIAHQVHQRIHQSLDHARVHFGVLTGRDQGDFFSCRSGHLTRRPAEPGEWRPDGHHPGAGNLIPHAERELLQLAHVFVRPTD